MMPLHFSPLSSQATSSAGPFDLDKVIGPAALYAGESMLVFTFAAAVVEKAFDLGLVKRFGQEPASAASPQDDSKSS